MSFVIRSFPSDKHLWRVDWLGKVRPNPNVDSEPRINVHLTRLADNYTDPFHKSSLLLEHQRTVSVGIGALPLLSIGSVWREKRCHDVPSQLQTATMRVNTADLVTTTFSGDFLGGYPYLSRRYYPVASHYPQVKDAPLYVVKENDPKARHKYYLIPMTELFRFYYVCSSFSAKCVWNNDLAKAINEEKSDLLEGNDLRIYLRKNLADYESWLLGRWFLSAEMRSQIRKMEAKRRIDAINTRQGEAVGAHPYIGFPFVGATTLSAIGKPIMVPGQVEGKLVEHADWAFLVTRIQTCSHPLPFRNLIVDRENNSLRGQNKDDEDLEPAWSPEVMPIKVQINGPDGKPELTNTEEPDKKLRGAALELFNQRFVDLRGKQLIKEEKEVQKYKSAKVIREGSTFVDSVSSADGDNANNGTAPINIALNPPTNQRLPANLETFVATLKYIREQENVDSVITVEFDGWSTQMDGEYVFHYPFRMRGKRSWHIISETPPKTRGVIVARVNMGSQTVYLIEIERKSDKRSTQIVYSNFFSKIENFSLHRFLLQTAARNNWPERRDFPNLNWEGTNHNAGDTIERYGDRILTKIAKITGIARPEKSKNIATKT